MVAAGSWHVDMPDGRRYNRCIVLRHDGEDLWSHDKLREYEVIPRNVADNPAAYRAIGVGPAGAVEAIHRGHTQLAYSLVANCGHFGSQAPSFCQWPATRDNIRRRGADNLLLTVDLNNTSIYDVD